MPNPKEYNFGGESLQQAPLMGSGGGVTADAPPPIQFRKMGSLWGNLKQNLRRSLDYPPILLGENNNNTTSNNSAVLLPAATEEEFNAKRRDNVEKITLSDSLQDDLLAAYLKEDGLTEDKLSMFLSRTLSLTIPFDFDVKPYFIVPEGALRKTNPLNEDDDQNDANGLDGGAIVYNNRPFPPPAGFGGGRHQAALLSGNSSFVKATTISRQNQGAGAHPGPGAGVHPSAVVTKRTDNNKSSVAGRRLSSSGYVPTGGGGGEAPTTVRVASRSPLIEEAPPPPSSPTVVYSPVLQPERLLLLVQHLMRKDKDLASTDISFADTYEALCATQPLASTIVAAKGDAPTFSGIVGFGKLRGGAGRNSSSTTLLGRLRMMNQMQKQQNSSVEGEEELRRFEQSSSPHAAGASFGSDGLSSSEEPNSPHNLGDHHVTKAKVMEALLPYYPQKAAKELAQVVVACGTKEADIGSFVNSYRETMGASGGVSGGGGSNNSSRLLKIFFKIGGRSVEDGIPPTLDANQLRFFCNSKSALLKFSDHSIERLVRLLDQDSAGVIEFDEFELAVTQERLQHSLQAAAVTAVPSLTPHGRRKSKSGFKEETAVARTTQQQHQPQPQSPQSPLLHLLQKVSHSLEQEGLLLPRLGHSVRQPSSGTVVEYGGGEQHGGAGQSMMMPKSVRGDNKGALDGGGQEGGEAGGGEEEDDWFKEGDESTVEQMRRQVESLQVPDCYEQTTGVWDEMSESQTPSRTSPNLEDAIDGKPHRPVAPRYMQPMGLHVYTHPRRVDVDPRFAASVRRNRTNLVERSQNASSCSSPRNKNTSQSTHQDQFNGGFLEERRGLPFGVLLEKGPGAQLESEALGSGRTAYSARRPSASGASGGSSNSTALVVAPGPPPKSSRLGQLSRQERGLAMCARKSGDRSKDNDEMVHQCQVLLRNKFGEDDSNWATRTAEDHKLLRQKEREEKIDASPKKLHCGEKKVSITVRSVYYAKAIRTTPRWDKKQEHDFRVRVLREKSDHVDLVPPADYDAMLRQVVDVTPRRDVVNRIQQQQQQEEEERHKVKSTIHSPRKPNSSGEKEKKTSTTRAAEQTTRGHPGQPAGGDSAKTSTSAVVRSGEA